MGQRDIAREYEQKKFFSTLYGTELATMGNFKDGQYVRVYKQQGKNGKVSFFNNIDDLVLHTSRRDIFKKDTFFTLAMTDGQAGTRASLRTRTILAFDFDKKDFEQGFNHIDIINKFKAIGLWYHILIDSGHGYHAYTCIEPTQDHARVKEVTEAIGGKLGADRGAMNTTQILRVPFTFNIKEEPKQVSIIYMYPDEQIKRYSIDHLYNKYCRKVSQKGTEGKITGHAINNTNIPPCIVEILKNGSKTGQRYSDLQKIVVTLRKRNKTLAEIQAICKEWNAKSDYNDSLSYRVEYTFKNRNHVSMDCQGCKHYKECFSRVESDFKFPDDTNILKMTETHTRHLKEPRRKGAKSMKGNDLLIYGVLKNHADGLYRAEIERELTYQGNIKLGKNTLSKALNSLEDNGFISVKTIDRKKFYQVTKIRSKAELTYDISYAATYECIKNNISPEELRLYNYMRYLHNKQQREDTKALKGNLFYFNQRDLAKEIGVTQGRISVMINNLLDEKLLGIWYRQPSKNNGFDYYIYRLNY